MNIGIPVKIGSRRPSARKWMYAGLLAVLLLAIMVGSPLHQTPPAEAQTVTTLVSNTGQTSGGTGTLSSGRRAQAFTTGPAAFGYKLSSIGIDFSNIASTTTAGGNIKVTLNSVSGSDPGSTLCTLRDPTTFTGSGVQTFNVPPDTDSNPCPRLRAETTYYVVVARTGTGSDAIVLDMTNSTAEDSGGAYGGSIADEQLSRTGLTWNRVTSQAHQIEVKGTAIESTTVPLNWALTPSGLATGDKFRLLFITNAGHAPTSDVISTYNTYVKNQANASNAHSAIKGYSSSFRVVGCTASAAARDNTATTYTTDSMGDVVDPVPIYWLNGNKVADEYEDFYDGTWDDETNPKNRGGGASNPVAGRVWSGCNTDGTAHSSTPLGNNPVVIGRLNGGGGPLNLSANSQNTVTAYGYYALSGVFVVPNDPATGAPTIGGTPRVNDILTADTTDIMDTNGLTSPDYTYQWVRIDGMTETDIGTDSSAYILTDDDEGKEIKVKVTFTDDLGEPEGPLESLPTDSVVAADVLVKNTEQASGSITRILDNNTTKRAMAFTTGASATGYTLNSVGFVFDTIANTSTAGSHLTATLNADSSNSPGSVLCTLTDPTSFSGSGLHTFSAPTTNPCPILTANTTYFAVIERVTHVFADTINLKETSSTNEDSGSVFDWSIGNNRHFFTSGSWGATTTGVTAHQIEVKGAAAPVLTAVGPTTFDYTYYADIDLSIVEDAWGIATDGQTFWISQDQPTVKYHAYHYKDDPGTSTVEQYGARDSAKDFNPPSNELVNLYGDDSYLWSCEFSVDNSEYFASGAGVVAHNLSDQSHDSDKDLKYRYDTEDEVYGGDNAPLQCLATVTYGGHILLSDSDPILKAFRITDDPLTTVSEYGARDPDYDVTTPGGGIRGLYREGNILWVSSLSDKKIYAIDIRNGNRLEHLEFDLRPETTVPHGIWSNGVTMFVVNGADMNEEVHTYYRFRDNASGTVTVDGSHKEGETLECSATDISDPDGLPSPLSFSYRWQELKRSGEWEDITGRTNTTYLINAADADRTLRCTFEFTDGSGYRDVLRGDAIKPLVRVSAFDLHSSNSAAKGIWGNGTHFWIANDGSGNANKLYAYKRSDGSRDTSADFDNLNTAGNTDVRGICSDGTTMFVADSSDAQVYAYKMSDTTRDSSKDITLDSTDNGDAEGVWCDGSTIWVSNDDGGTTSKIFAYKQADSTRDSGKDFAAGTLNPSTNDGTLNNSDPRGLWANGTTMFSVDHEDAKIYAYKMADQTGDTDKNISLHSDNGHPQGLWFDGRVLWVVDNTDDRVYVYDLPGAQPDNTPATGTPTVSGTLSQGDTLTADTSGITDSTDGITNALFLYQWIRVDGTTDTELDGETGSTYTTTADDADKNIKVRVVFDDDAGYQEYPRFSSEVGPVLGPPPEVTSVTLTSDPNADSIGANDDNYVIGNAVTATVTFDKAVDITGSPQITLLFGTAEKAADCEAGSNTTTMACTYGVAVNDTAPSGVGIKANSLVLNSGTIYATGGTTNAATLTHSALSLQSGHKVDGIRPALVTTGSDVPRTSTDGSQIILTFNKNIFSVDRSKIKLFESGTTPLSSTAASSSNKIVTITLTNAILSTSGPITVELVAEAVDDVPGNSNAAQSSTSVTVNLQATPLAPTSLTAEPAPDETPQLAVDLSWTAPLSDGGSAITSHQYRYNRNGGSFGSWTTIDDSAANGAYATSFTVKGLSAVNNAGTTFTFEVRAINANGNGTESDPATAHIGWPDQIATLTAVSGDGQIELSWDTPANNGSAILRYQYSVINENTQTHVVNSATNIPNSDADTTTVTVTGLTNGVPYSIGIAAVNSVKAGPIQLAENIIPATFPTAPRRLSAEAGDSQVTLRWTAPTSNGGNAIDGYEYQQKTGSAAYGSWTDITGADENTTEHTVTGLSNGTSYSFKVRAKNPVGGEGPESNEATAVPVTVPSAPQTFDATAGNGRVRLDWTAPSSDGGNPIVRYEFRYKAGSGSFTTWATVPGSNINTTTHNVTGLTNGTVHTFEVRAATSTHKGVAASDTATPMAVKPDKPSVTVENRPESLYVSWSVSDDGGSQITEYQVQWAESGQSFGATDQKTGLTSTNTLIEGLTNFTIYNVRVRAMNAIDWSDWSTTRSGTPTPRPPPSVSITASVSEPVRAPFRVTITFTDQDLDGNDTNGVVGFEADEIIAWYTSRGNATYEFQVTDFRVETPGRVYSALIDKIIDGKLWIEVEEDSAQSSLDDQGNTLAYETWQVDAPDPPPAPEGAEIWSATLTVGGEYPDGYGLDGKDTGTRGYFKGWSPASTNDVRYGALSDTDFNFSGDSYEILELSHTASWRVVRLRLCPRPELPARTFELRLGDKWLIFHGQNNSTRDFSRTRDGSVQQCREYDWDQVTLDWQYGQSVNVRITR